MKREEKAAVVDDLAERLGAAEAIFAVDYRGISVPQAAELRSKLRESDATFKIVKNRLAKLAAEKAGTEIDELLNGPIALTLIEGDAALAAKAISNFTREHEVLEFKGGLMDGAALDPDSFKAIAKLPGRDVLYGQLVGMTASPLTGLAAGLSNLISGLGRQLAQMAEQGLVTGEAPAEAPAEEPPAEEAPADETEAPADEAPEPEAPVEEPTPAGEPAPEEAPVEEPPPDEPAPEPEAAAETDAGPEPETETEADSPEEAEAEGDASEDEKEEE